MHSGHSQPSPESVSRTAPPVPTIATSSRNETQASDADSRVDAIRQPIMDSAQESGASAGRGRGRGIGHGSSGTLPVDGLGGPEVGGNL